MHFDKRVINLESRPDRRQEIQSQLNSIGWSADFVKATRPDDQGDFPSIGARGCFLSHLSALKSARGHHLILMEDDLNFVRGFSQRWEMALAALPKGWSIFYAGHEVEGGDGVRLVQPDHAIKGAHFVVFNALALDFIIEQLELFLSRQPGHISGGPMHVDGAYSTIRAQNPTLRTYAVFPPLGYQRSSASDITPKMVDRLKIFRPLTSKARRALRLLKERSAVR